jgi:hypothetical protein
MELAKIVHLIHFIHFSEEYLEENSKGAETCYSPQPLYSKYIRELVTRNREYS